VWEFAIMLLIIGAIVVLAAPWIMRRRGAGSDWQPGTMLVTGVSPRPDDLVGEQFVTITGVINGPTVNEHVIYQRMAVDIDNWPTMGELFPVMYSPKNPDNWAFTQGEAPPAPPAPPPPPPGPTELR
jgi:hypothetical protein